MAPVVVFGAIFYAFPILFSLWLSLTDATALRPAHWVGLANYAYLFTRDPFFVSTLAHTALFAAGNAAIGIPLGLGIAHLVAGARGKAMWRTFFLAPMVTNVVAAAYVWDVVLDPAYGIVNRVLGWLGLPGPGWLSDPKTALLSVVIVSVWLSLGQTVLLFSAGLEGLDTALFEAARLDGATGWQVFRRITVPLLRPTILFVAVTNLIAGLGSFALVLVLTGGGPQESTNVTALYLYQTAFENLRMGRASAMAYVLFAVILAVTLALLRILRRGGVEAF